MLIYAKNDKARDWTYSQLTVTCGLTLSSYEPAESFLGIGITQHLHDESSTTRKGISVTCPGAIATWKDTYNRPDATQPTIVSDDFDEIINEPWEAHALTSTELQIQKQLQAVIGCLRFYAAWNRHDILVQIHCSRIATRFVSPTQRILDEAFHIMDYVRGTPNEGLYFPHESEDGATGKLSFCSDASLHTDRIHGRFQYGFFILFNGTPILAVSKLHRCAADGTNWAEWIALSEGIKPLMILRRILQETGHPVAPPRRAKLPGYIPDPNDYAIACELDSEGAWRAGTSEVRQKATLFHAAKAHHVWWRQNIGSIVLRVVKTHDNPADILTKNLRFEDIQRHWKSFPWTPPPSDGQPAQ